MYPEAIKFCQLEWKIVPCARIHLHTFFSTSVGESVLAYVKNSTTMFRIATYNTKNDMKIGRS